MLWQQMTRINLLKGRQGRSVKTSLRNSPGSFIISLPLSSVWLQIYTACWKSHSIVRLLLRVSSFRWIGKSWPNSSNPFIEIKSSPESNTPGLIFDTRITLFSTQLPLVLRSLFSSNTQLSFSSATSILLLDSQGCLLKYTIKYDDI